MNILSKQSHSTCSVKYEQYIKTLYDNMLTYEKKYKILCDLCIDDMIKNNEQTIYNPQMLQYTVDTYYKYKYVYEIIKQKCPIVANYKYLKPNNKIYINVVSLYIDYIYNKDKKTLYELFPICKRVIDIFYSNDNIIEYYYHNEPQELYRFFINIEELKNRDYIDFYEYVILNINPKRYETTPIKKKPVFLKEVPPPSV